MPRYNVNHKNKWACFSSVVDGFITRFMDNNRYEHWRRNQYREDYRPIEECNKMDMEKAVFLIRLHNTHEESVKHLIECGLSLEESEKFIYNIETVCWCPVLNESGTLECPNCGSEVEKEQVSCREKTCEIEFVWRG